MRYRLYELAKELEVPNKDLVAVAMHHGMAVKSHSSTIDGAEANRLRMHYGRPVKADGAGARSAAEIKRAAAARKARKAAAPPKPPAPSPAKERPAPASRAGAPPRPREGARPGGPRPAGPRPPRPAQPPASADAGGSVTGERRRPARPRRGRAGGATPRTDLPVGGPPEPAGRDAGAPARGRIRRTDQPTATDSASRRRGRRGPRRGGRRTGTRSRVALPLSFERPTKITVDFPVTLRAFSAASGVKLDALMRTLLQSNVMATLNDPLGADIVELLGAEFSIEVEVRKGRDLESEVEEASAKADRPEDLKLRAPVVAFLGHVDHGKTSLLDAIRQSHVVDTEAGGITQHIGAYAVRKGSHSVVFLDTPGHEAFTAMRARGAQVTDIVVLVVAADDGIMPQTEEAISHAKAAGVPIVVALNKIDLPGANPDRVMQQFTTHEILPAKWGGETEFVPVSAITKQGIDDLVETLALQAEILELKANPDKAASGTIIEAELSEGRGSVATVLVMDGTLRIGDIVLCGAAYGRVRSLHDDRGRSIEEAGPAEPVEIAGLSAVPRAGDRLFVLEDLDKARGIAETRTRREREASLAERAHVTLENLFAQIEEGKQKELRLILKADVQGSLEVLRKTLLDMSTAEVAVNILHSAVGGINESDILLADASDAIVIGFHVVAESPARLLGEAKKIDVRLYNVIYHLKDDIKAALEDRLEPERRENVLGHVEIRRIFRTSRFGNIAGCFVLDGRVNRNDRARLIRDNIVIYEGKLSSLRREKDDVREVQSGFECGVNIEGYNDIKEGDALELFEIQEIKRHLD